jgi:hypothetical protein
MTTVTEKRLSLSDYQKPLTIVFVEIPNKYTVLLNFSINH